VLCKETHETVIRIAPPLMISREDLDWGLAQIQEVLEGRVLPGVDERSLRSEEGAFSQVV
jgi:hypothetical protein